LWSEALDVLGQFVDAPTWSNGDPPLGNVVSLVARQVAARPVAEQYERLRAWTMPTADRRSIRLLAAFIPEDGPPAVFGAARPVPPRTSAPTRASPTGIPRPSPRPRRTPRGPCRRGGPRTRGRSVTSPVRRASPSCSSPR